MSLQHHNACKLSNQANQQLTISTSAIHITIAPTARVGGTLERLTASGGIASMVGSTLASIHIAYTIATIDLGTRSLLHGLERAHGSASLGDRVLDEALLAHTRTHSQPRERGLAFSIVIFAHSIVWSIETIAHVSTPSILVDSIGTTHTLSIQTYRTLQGAILLGIACCLIVALGSLGHRCR